ncbi:MAG: tRNA (adenosine(37)-N6)-threonylcarbamoyltransferase complex dimerization subunit type 1 TsaB [Bacteroidota bacterium]|jgi:tRNA threonylcarbamoyladenosine biosynthesis protein TsaB|nr:tRNA (adenosine(37)-N6)-threonylcarbamoyltransferase complex dimerization subunit type 1 TsaB [Ignavibacteria bacterium]MCU7500954.1 tRNA (adenosine(37)-N6)-threonylcarbamoyltransferase complex dimerization subunit type 1 TsaB [Ignavibacteria bacterium]MCU7511336.1 tRNA (adenosine(37)-N6)-threonylcarbamoyltransferase complex dimerization subunit type 1 TsaB [Ignavibacteria bacterium]MCU7519309.1 tRNA (adenosine(37)-N6)-threonylcarbamoyltransferase complex dimerization subunit type 1 TsaB [Ign
MMKISENKPILSVETSGELCSAAVYFNDSKYTEINLMLKHVHSEKLLDVVDDVLKSAGVLLKEVQAVAVSSGPGSFTGLRIGMSAVKGLAIGGGLPIISVPTFEALAFQASAYLPEGSKFIVANKVNIEELYYAKFLSTKDGYQFIEPLQVIYKGDLDEKLSDGSVAFGNAVKNADKMPVSSPSASLIAKWAYLFGKDLLTYDFDFLEPAYLKNFIIR